jgi:hypothetical protein
MVIEEPQASDFWRGFSKRVQMQQCDVMFITDLAFEGVSLQDAAYSAV